MKILILTNMFPSKRYPAYGTFVKNFVNGLESNNISVFRLITVYKTHNILIKFYYYLNFVFKGFLSSLRINKYDLIYIHFPTYSILPIWFNPFLKKKIVLNFHGDDLIPQHIFSKFLFKLVNKKFLSASLIVVPSLYYKTILREKINYNIEKILVSPSGGIDFSKFYPYNFKPICDSIRIGFLSRIDPGKGWEVFLESLSILKQRKIPFQAIIGGNGSEFDAMIKTIEKLDLLDNITIEGAIPHDSVPLFFNKLDLFVFSSTRQTESLGLVAVEALACGIPIIAKRNGAIDEFVQNGENGFIFENSFSVGISSMVMKYIELPELKKLLMKKKAFESVRKFDSKMVATNLCNTLKNL